MPAKIKAPHHRGDYQVRAKRVTDYAYSNPDTRCWRCHRTLAEVRKDKPKAIWTAGHVRDGDPASPLLPECEPCNKAGGARITNSRKAKRTPLTLRLHS